MDIERIIHSDIPDIAQVYGGVRGRAMTAKYQGREWPMLLESGLKTVIDLRYEDQTKRLAVICEELGVNYFHYPVGRHGESASLMVEKFDAFCGIIDEGDFFISCREGLHRTDVALCTYWMFYGADKGVPQPELHGFLEEGGKDLLRMNQCLNAFFRKSVEKNGVEPIPMNVFKERKALIKKAWEKHVETIEDGNIPEKL